MDTSEAGIGDLDVNVSCNGTRVSTSISHLGDDMARFTFLPNMHLDHIVDVAFNYEKVPGELEH